MTNTESDALIARLRRLAAGLSTPSLSGDLGQRLSEAANTIESDAKRIAALEAEVERIRQRFIGCNEERQRQDTRAYEAEAALRAATERAQAAEQDARRYRLLRDDRSNALHLSRNGDHAANYVSAKEWIEERSPEWFANDSPEELAAMKATNTIWTLQIYPRTPVGFNVWNASTLDAAIDAALAAPQGEP